MLLPVSCAEVVGSLHGAARRASLGGCEDVVCQSVLSRTGAQLGLCPCLRDLVRGGATPWSFGVPGTGSAWTIWEWWVPKVSVALAAWTQVF